MGEVENIGEILTRILLYFCSVLIYFICALHCFAISLLYVVLFLINIIFVIILSKYLGKYINYKIFFSFVIWRLCRRKSLHSNTNHHVKAYYCISATRGSPWSLHRATLGQDPQVTEPTTSGLLTSSFLVYVNRWEFKFGSVSLQYMMLI